MTIKKIEEGAKVTLLIEGRVDTNTSPELQRKILEAFQGASELVLDFSQVAYISSAGLRAILIGQKTATSKRGVFRLIHVSKMVMQVLESVGFAKILNIETD